MLEKLDGSHFAIYLTAVSDPPGDSVRPKATVYLFCYATGSTLLNREEDVLCDPASYKSYLAYLIPPVMGGNIFGFAGTGICISLLRSLGPR